MTSIETYYLNNNSINIPLNMFLKEKRKYFNFEKSITKKKRYLYNNFECIVNKNGFKECYNKTLISHIINERLIIEWQLKKIEWPEDIDWQETEEYLCEEYKTNKYIIQFITTSKRFRRILIKNV